MDISAIGAATVPTTEAGIFILKFPAALGVFTKCTPPRCQVRINTVVIPQDYRASRLDHPLRRALGENTKRGEKLVLGSRLEKEFKIIVFQEEQIRRIWHNDEWWFSVLDVIEVLAETVNPTDYLRKM